MLLGVSNRACHVSMKTSGQCMTSKSNSSSNLARHVAKLRYDREQWKKLVTGGRSPGIETRSFGPCTRRPSLRVYHSVMIIF